MEKIPISKFKTNCTAIVDQVAKTGEPVTITRSGKAIAEIVPAATKDSRPPHRDVMPDTVDLDDDLLEEGDLELPEQTLRAWDDLNSAIDRDVSTGSRKSRRRSKKT